MILCVCRFLFPSMATCFSCTIMICYTDADREEETIMGPMMSLLCHPMDRNLYYLCISGGISSLDSFSFLACSRFIFSTCDSYDVINDIITCTCSFRL